MFDGPDDYMHYLSVKRWISPSGQHGLFAPDYPRSFKDLREAEIKFGLHNTDNLELRVKWINSFRMVVSRRCPKNNSGTPIVSDIDLLNASEEERCEALVRAIGKWPKKNLQTQNQQNKGTKNERTNNTN